MISVCNFYSATMAEGRENIVLFPFMAQGHIIPFLALGRQLAKRGYTITFVNTPLNIKRIRSSLPSNSCFRFKEIPFNSVEHGLPPNCENTNDLPYHLFMNLLGATTSFKPEFEKIMEELVREQNGHPPLCVIGDLYFGFCADVAHKHGVFHALFSIACALGLACYSSIALKLPHVKTKSDEFIIPGFDGLAEMKIHRTQLPESLRNADGTEPLSTFLRKVLPEGEKADALLFNTVEGIDKIGLMTIRRKYDRPVWAIGPLLLPAARTETRAGKEAGINPDFIKNWLDSKPPSSVLFISFGSQNSLSPSPMMQLAMALEASGKNFIWVVRPPSGFDINSEFKADEYLPKGFEQRMLDEKRGLLVRQWAPQVEILSHKSTGAFLSHCGWSSTLEALMQGLPSLVWPMASEQFYTSILVTQELEVCVEVARGKNAEVTHEDIRAKIDLVMNETEKGKELKSRACKMREVLVDAMKDDPEKGYKGSSVLYMDEFLNTALKFRHQKQENKSSLN